MGTNLVYDTTGLLNFNIYITIEWIWAEMAQSFGSIMQWTAIFVTWYIEGWLLIEGDIFI